MRRIHFLLAFLVLVSVVSAQNVNVRGNLFNGKDLSGWNQPAGQSTFKVEKGEIVTKTASANDSLVLTSDKEDDSFILDFEVFVDCGANAAVQFRSKPEGADGKMAGYHCRTGSLHIHPNGDVYCGADRGWIYTGELNPAPWNKLPKPVFYRNDELKRFGPGQSIFTVAEDGKTDLMVYHGSDHKEIEVIRLVIPTALPV